MYGHTLVSITGMPAYMYTYLVDVKHKASQQVQAAGSGGETTQALRLGHIKVEAFKST